MNTKSGESHPVNDCKRMKYEDLQMFSRIFSNEFNNSSLHDRVLVFETIEGQGKLKDGNGKVTRKGKRKRKITEEEKGEAEVEEDEKRRKKIFVHSSWLAVQSPYFRALFYSGMKESFSKEVVIKIAENELEAHLTLIEAMYRMEVLDDKDYSLVLQILVLANMYDVDLVFKKCNYIMMSTPLTLEICEEIIQTISGLSACADLIIVLEKFLVKEFMPFDKTWILDKFIHLSKASLKLLLSSDHLPVQCENTIFVALMKWIDTNLTASDLDVSFLLHLVRFELMTIDFLHDVVSNHAAAKKMLCFNSFLQKGLAYHGFSQERRTLLKTKPVKRPHCSDHSPTFSWIIDKDVRKKLLDSSKVQSSPYWYKGYQMNLSLGYNPDSNKFSLHMFVHNMKEESYLNIRWIAKSILFKSRFIIVNKIYSGADNWGHPELESTVGLVDLSEAVSYTIDVSVKFV